MKKSAKKLSLNRETVRILADPTLDRVGGGAQLGVIFSFPATCRTCQVNCPTTSAVPCG